jgi:cbb3-type cytochrome oxidase maturation protein
MSVIVILLLASISVAGLFLAAFLWSVKSGQFSDEISPPLRMLLDNPVSTEPNHSIDSSTGNLSPDITDFHKQPQTKTTN